MKDDTKINDDARYQALVYLINKIVGRKKLRQCDYVRNSRLLYMLLLEYASCCENLRIPSNSPIAKLDFTRYEKGPGEDFYYENHDMIYRDIKSGRIPQFEQTGFLADERVQLDIACKNTRHFYGATSTEKLDYFIMYELPYSRKLTFLETYKMRFDRKEFLRELNAFIRKRAIFYSR